MKSYAVTLPVAGSIIVFVEAEDPNAAVDAALEKQDWQIKTGEGTEAGEHWEALRYIGRGNVSYAPCNEFSVEEDI